MSRTTRRKNWDKAHWYYIEEKDMVSKWIHPRYRGLTVEQARARSAARVHGDSMARLHASKTYRNTLNREYKVRTDQRLRYLLSCNREDEMWVDKKINDADWYYF